MKASAYRSDRLSAFPESELRKSCVIRDLSFREVYGSLDERSG